jgi:rhodanese-related sulfurtransferase
VTTDAPQQELSPDRVSELLERGDAELVDVRTPGEWEAGHIAGARHIPFDELPRRSGELDRSRQLVLYCRSGGRSSTAAQAFRASGWEAHAMEGGILGWGERGLPLEPEDGEVTHPSGLPAD